MGAGTNAHLLGSVATHSVCHSQTVLLGRRYGLPLPPNVRDEPGDEARGTDGTMRSRSTDDLPDSEFLVRSESDLGFGEDS
jgi:hypothetical protein